MKHYLWNRFIFSVLRHIAGPIIKRVMRYKCRKHKGPEAPSLIISNHNTNLDPALVALGFSRHIYFLSSEHALRNGFPSKVLKFIFSPISINKSRADLGSIKEIIRRLRKGVSVCVFAEGDRSFTGTTSPVSISTAKLAKASGADMITFRLEGGYFTSPRWSKRMRKGRMSGHVVNIYPAAELKGMTYEEILSVIERDIYVDAYEGQGREPIRYRGRDLAEHIEAALYLCPNCGHIETIHSKGDFFFCDCGLKGAYTETCYLEGEKLPFSTITEWGVWQKEKLEQIVQGVGEGAICSSEDQQLYEVRAAEGKKLIGEGSLWINREALHCAGMTFPLEKITRLTTVGKMKLLFALGSGTTYEVYSKVPRSALVYREIFRILRQEEKSS